MKYLGDDKMKYILVKENSEYDYSWKDLTGSGQAYMTMRVHELLKKELSKVAVATQIKKYKRMAERKGYSPKIVCEVKIAVKLLCDTPHFSWKHWIKLRTEDYTQWIESMSLTFPRDDKINFINIHQTKAENAAAKEFIAGEKRNMQPKDRIVRDDREGTMYAKVKSLLWPFGWRNR